MTLSFYNPDMGKLDNVKIKRISIQTAPDSLNEKARREELKRTLSRIYKRVMDEKFKKSGDKVN